MPMAHMRSKRMRRHPCMSLMKNSSKDSSFNLRGDGFYMGRRQSYANVQMRP